MPKVKFYLDFRGDSPLKPIFLALNHNYGKRKNYSVINNSISPVSWNKKAKGSPECVKGTSKESVELRDKLKTIKHQLEVDIPDLLSKDHGISKKEQTIDQIFNEFLKRNNIEVKQPDLKKQKTKITEYIQEFIEIHSSYDPTTLAKYKRLRETMEDFVAKEGESLLLKKIDYPWLSKYCNYLCVAPRQDGKVGYENDYIETLFRKMNSTLNYFDIISFKVKKIMGHLRKFNGQETDSRDIDLSEALKIYSFDCVMDGKVNESWLKARDLYIWSFFNGHRHNELYALTKHIVDERMDIEGKKYKVLKYVSDKEGNSNEITLNEICIDIIDRWSKVKFEIERTTRAGEKIIYKDPLLPVMSGSKCNKYLHELMEEIAFRDSVDFHGTSFTRETQDKFEPVSFYKKKLRVRYVGARRKEDLYSMWEYTTFKTSRTSTACVLADAGVSDADIASLLNNNEETTKKYYAKRKRSLVNQRTSEAMDVAVKKASGIKGDF
jgi:hypothetical protein